jgi:hypothetical protein
MQIIECWLENLNGKHYGKGVRQTRGMMVIMVIAMMIVRSVK